MFAIFQSEGTTPVGREWSDQEGRDDEIVVVVGLGNTLCNILNDVLSADDVFIIYIYLTYFYISGDNF